MHLMCINLFFINSLYYKVELGDTLTLYWMDLKLVQERQNC